MEDREEKGERKGPGVISTPRPFSFSCIFFYDVSGFAVAAKNCIDLVLYELLDISSGRSEVLARVEMIRMCRHVLTDAGSQCQAKVRVNVDLADCGFCSFAELFLRNAYSVSKIAAVLVDDLYIFRDNGGCTMQNNREVRQAFFNFGKDVETKLWRYEDTVSIARALLRLEFESTMACADSNSEGIYAGSL